MRFRVLSLLAASGSLAATLAAQQLQQLQPPVADTGIFSPIPLPTANDIRRPDGSPGRGYWQQRASYTIKATLDTAAKKLAGTVAIRYTNNSPDTLRFVWLQLDQNLFRPGSVGSLTWRQWQPSGFAGGFEIERAEQLATTGPAGRAVAAVRAAAGGSTRAAAPGKPLKSRVDDTMMQLWLATPLAPGATTTLQLAYHFNIPDEHGADRMGRDGSLYELAQWYPRMAVYDDVHGWNTDQYLGPGEFYLEYGDFDYEVTVPAGYIVAGTGVLQNAAEVLTATQRSRLAAAAKSDTTIAIVTEAELQSGAARPTKTGTLTWKFHAKDVRDVAWAGSPEYLWDASSWQGILAQAYYRPAAREGWRGVADTTRLSIQEYSTRWLRYPYPQISVVEGPAYAGMEYPMLAMVYNVSGSNVLALTVTHEIGHMWFPMIVGSDERRYAWMDEGFNTFITTFFQDKYFDQQAVQSNRQSRQADAQYVAQSEQYARIQPIMTPANRYLPAVVRDLAYTKPSVVLLALRNKVLGAEVFDSAFREYARRWAFKHPQPADFFRTMENVAGRDLSWFWRGFIYRSGSLDQAIEGIHPGDYGGTDIVLKNNGSAVMPVELEITFADGKTQTVNLPVEIWYKGDRYVHNVPTGKVASADINPDRTLPDAVPANNMAIRAGQ